MGVFQVDLLNYLSREARLKTKYIGDHNTEIVWDNQMVNFSVGVEWFRFQTFVFSKMSKIRTFCLEFGLLFEIRTGVIITVQHGKRTIQIIGTNKTSIQINPDFVCHPTVLLLL